MNLLVVDASAILTLGFEDEDNSYGQRVLDHVEAGGILLAPCIWPAEVANTIVIAERRGRLDALAATRFLALFSSLVVELDYPSASYIIDSILPLARQYGLTVYDALYLELALRLKAPVATLDKKLKEAARQAGATIM